MGTRRSRHNKGRKPLYKEHRQHLVEGDGASGDETAAYAEFCKVRWPETCGKPVCPFCGSQGSYEITTRRKFKCAGGPTRYSPARGVEKILAPLVKRSDRGRRAVLVLACYMDDSGTHPESSVVTVAGFVTTMNHWAAFETAAARVFASNQVTLLHTHHLHATKGEFKGWSGAKKAAFCTELASHLVPMDPFGVSVSAAKAMYSQRKAEYHAWHNTSAFGTAFSRAILLIYWQLFYDTPYLMEHPEIDLSIILEDGNNNNNDALSLFNYLKHERKLSKLSSMSFAGKRDSIAIQTADLLAFYTRRWMDECVKSGKQVSKPSMLSSISKGLDIWTEAITDFAKLGDLDTPGR